MVNYSNIQMQFESERKIRVKIHDGIQLIPSNHVLYIEAEAPYTYLHLLNGDKIFCCESIRSFDEKLSTHGFVRIHKSLLVNIASIDCYKKEASGTLLLIDGTQLKLARGKKSLLLEKFETHFL